jgi:outer membrane protein assembly factor BamB
MSFVFKNTVCTIIITIFLSGCLQDKLAEGLRVSITEQEIDTIDSFKIKVPKVVDETSWGGAAKEMREESRNYLLRDNFEREWTIDTGLGQIIGTPVISNDKVFVFGANGQVKCIDLITQETVWNLSVHPINKIKKRIIGGGLSFDSAGNLYVTSSLGELLSISMGSGALNWRYNSDAQIMDGPTVVNDRIFITETSGVSRSFSATGKSNWSVDGLSGEHIRSKTGKPVSFSEMVLLPSAGGMLNAVNAESGSKIWSFQFLNQRLGYAQNTFGAFNGEPGVFAEYIYYGSVNGQFNKLNKFGESVWQVEVGLQGSPLIISNSIFFISDRSELVRLNKNSGNLIWSRNILADASSEHYFSPILAGSRLWLTGVDSFLRSFDVESGNLQDKISIGSKSVGPPIYYSGSIIVYTESGELIAFK